MLARKSKAHPAPLSYRGHGLMDNRLDLVVDCRVSQADGYGERSAAQAMVFDRPSSHQKTIGADKGKGYDMRGYSKSINARRGIEKVGPVFGLHVIAYNLIRLGNLLKPAIAAS